MNTSTTLPADASLTGGVLQMEALPADDPRLGTMRCLPMPFGTWRDANGSRVFVPDPTVYAWNGNLYAHPVTMRARGLGVVNEGAPA